MAGATTTPLDERGTARVHACVPPTHARRVVFVIRSCIPLGAQFRMTKHNGCQHTRPSLAAKTRAALMRTPPKPARPHTALGTCDEDVRVPGTRASDPPAASSWASQHGLAREVATHTWSPRDAVVTEEARAASKQGLMTSGISWHYHRAQGIQGHHGEPLGPPSRPRA